jgi:hypothetical protein
MSRKRSNPRTTTKVGQAMTRMREGASLTRASREVGVTRRTVERLAGSALQRGPSGRYTARASDRLAREVRLPSSGGLQDVTLRDSKQARLVGQYWNAVHAHSATGDSSPLRRFEGKHVVATNGEHVPLLVDTDVLDELGNAGVLSFESIYPSGV